MRTSVLLLPIPLLTLHSAANAQSISILVQVGEIVPGVGAVTSIQDSALNGEGRWIAAISTNFPEPVPGRVLLRDGSIFLRGGDLIEAPNVVVRAFGDIKLDVAGRVASIMYFPTSLAAPSGVCVDTTIVLREGGISTAPQFDPGTTYVEFFQVKSNDANQILLVADADDPAVPGAGLPVALRVQIDAAGALVSETVLLELGDAVPGIAGRTVAFIDNAEGASALNESGVAMLLASLTGTADADRVVLVGGAPVLREGDASPVAGRTWEDFGLVDLNDAGDWVVRGSLNPFPSADGTLICKNNTTVVARTGTTLPAIQPRLLESLGFGYVRISNAGDVFYVGEWDDPDTTRDRGIFRNQELLVQEGVTQVGGQPITSLSVSSGSPSISRDGRWLLFRGTLGSADALFLMDLGGQVTGFCFGDGTSAPCPCGNASFPGQNVGCLNSFLHGGRLRASGTASLAGDTLALLGSQMPSAPALYFQGTAQVGGGLGVTFGDGLRCAGGLVVRLKQVLNSGGASRYPEQGDPPVSVRGLIGAPGIRTYQVWYRNSASFCTDDGWNLTNGVELNWLP